VSLSVRRRAPTIAICLSVASSGYAADRQSAWSNGSARLTGLISVNIGQGALARDGLLETSQFEHGAVIGVLPPRCGRYHRSTRHRR
jgi:hypothetical protein